MQRRVAPQAKSGCMVACFCYYPFSSRPEENLKVLQDEQVYQWYPTDILSNGEYPYYMERFFKENNVHITVTEEEKRMLRENTCDFTSFSYYQSSVISLDEKSKKTAGNLVVSTKNPYLKATEWGWEIDPVGLRTTINKMYDRYHKPVFVSENGFGSRDVIEKDHTIHDMYRAEYLKNHFAEIDKAIEDGCDVLGYIMWGVIDIVSAGSEMEKRYGVVYVDANNQGEGSYKRYKKDSFAWYQNFIAQRHQEYGKAE